MKSIITPVISIACLCLAFAPATRGNPDGGIPGQNTAEGDFALANIALGTGNNNTATGWSALSLDTNGDNNTATGSGALQNNEFGADNTATGFNALFTNTTGSFNTATGSQALLKNTADNNTATGFQALMSNTTGTYNTATGVFALANNNADDNTATGYAALAQNMTGGDNTATGVQALLNNQSGSSNTATGLNALEANMTGNDNTATGDGALLENNADNNTATGANALHQNATGTSNTATGWSALAYNATGNNNTASGFNALGNNSAGNNNTATGYAALVNNSGNNNIALGSLAGANLTNGSNNIDIGNAGVGGESGSESNTIRIGKTGTQTATYIAGIRGATVARGVAVFVDSSGHLGTPTSSERFKDQIKPMDKASEAILALRPVTFRYKRELDPDGIPQFGLVAEQVAKVDPDLVARDADGKAYTVRYEAVNAMLLNEFLKQHRKVEEQDHKAQERKAMIADQQKEIKVLAGNLEEQASQIRKVRHQIEVRSTRRAPGAADGNE